jgi:exosortase/archaeosortase family protein
MTFVSLGAAVAFLSDRPLWQRLLITFSAVPIAILCNALRVSGQGLLDYYVDESWSTGFAHQFAGLVMLLPGFLLLMGVVWMLDMMFVDDDEAPPAAAQAAGGAA